MEQDIRWKQRFENYEKAFFQLQRFMEKESLNEFEEQGFIQCFEYNYELAWNLMKDYLTYQGITGITGSRDAIRQAFNKGLIRNGKEWMQMIDDRILTVHSYNEETAKLIEKRIYDVYYVLFEDLYNQMKTYLCTSD
jgi:nucleotidyltransferase substrate binding protein (TIGR01987 family)